MMPTASNAAKPPDEAIRSNEQSTTNATHPLIPPTYAERERANKKMKRKNNSWSGKRSLKARNRHLKKPVRDTVAVYNCRSMKTYRLAEIKLSTFKTKFLTSPLASVDNKGSNGAPTALGQDGPSSTNIEGAGVVSEGLSPDSFSEFWPDGSRKISTPENHDNIVFPDYGKNLDPCNCSRDFFHEECSNADAGVYCTPDNCSRDGRCSNSVSDFRELELVKTQFGYGVRATAFISVGCVIGEYTGILTTHDYNKDKDMISEYALELQTRASRKKVFIDAKYCGGLTRFINHSCNPNCIFAEACNRRHTKVLVVVIKPIRNGADVTVSYGDKLWFTCGCDERNCQSNTV